MRENGVDERGSRSDPTTVAGDAALWGPGLGLRAAFSSARADLSRSDRAPVLAVLRFVFMCGFRPTTVP